MPDEMNNHTPQPAKKRVTIGDIARIAGVSVSTVSRVLNNSTQVNKATQKKIMKVIREHEYTPSELARGLVSNTSNTIGILIPDIFNPYYSELTKSVETAVSSKGFSLFLCITDGVPEKEAFYINEMIKRRTDGLVILSTKISSKSLVNRMRQSMELVAVEADIEGIDHIRITNEEGTYQAIEHLIEYGHRDIAFIGYQMHLTSLAHRYKGFLRALTDSKIPIEDSYIIEGEPTGNSGYKMTRHLLSLPRRPTAIHCMNEYLATGAYVAINESGLRIPQDISVTAFDDLSTSKVLKPRLTTTAMPIEEMGTAAAELLIRNITEGHKSVPQLITFPTRLIIRESTQPI